MSVTVTITFDSEDIAREFANDLTWLANEYDGLSAESSHVFHDASAQVAAQIGGL